MPPESRKRSRELARAIGDRPDRIAQILEDALPQLNQTFRRRRHADLASDTQKQRLAEFLFEQENLPADRRLRHVQLAPTCRERTGLGDRLQDFELTQVHNGGHD